MSLVPKLTISLNFADIEQWAAQERRASSPSQQQQGPSLGPHICEPTSPHDDRTLAGLSREGWKDSLQTSLVWGVHG